MTLQELYPYVYAWAEMMGRDRTSARGIAMRAIKHNLPRTTVFIKQGEVPHTLDDLPTKTREFLISMVGSKCKCKRDFSVCVRFDDKPGAWWLESRHSFQPEFGKALVFDWDELISALSTTADAIDALGLRYHVTSIVIAPPPEEHAS